MKRYIFRLLLICVLCASGLAGYGQEKQQITSSDYTNRSIEMADNFRGEGKIYVVVAVVLSLLGVVVFYLVRMDVKITKLETRVEEHIRNKNKN